MEIKQVLKQLCLSSAPCGSESDLYDICKSFMQPFGECHVDNRGNFLCTKEGKGMHFLLDAHLDQIGFAVTAIEQGGFLKLAKVGGVDRRTAPSGEVLVLGKEPLFGVIACKPPHLTDENDKNKAPEFEDLSVDTGLDSEQLEKLVSIGDRVVFKPYFAELLGDRIAATSLDDRAGIAIIYRVMELLKQNGSEAKITAVFSAQEEVGGKGAGNAAFYTQAQEAIVVDVSFATQPELSEQSKKNTMPLGGGAFIGFAPVLNKQMSKAFVETAQRHAINYCCEVMGGTTGTNADEIASFGCGTKTITVSPPIRNMHTAVELCSLADLEACANLIARYILSKEGK